ncbi:MAG TPA: class I SAM-dependent methyltransferase [Candidatus Methylacidiphilales bacterium]|nr:class I SAM-dependent methyltransferase [Candidatus Methylacidiphilales bacterium]
MNPLSPLAPDAKVEHVRTYETEQLCREWLQTYQIDVASEFEPGVKVEKYRCTRSGLGFFSPPSLEGSAKLYDDLAKFDWYYIADKWEYSVALEYIKPGQRILEVGCGSGAFLKKAAAFGCKPVGLEINPKVAEVDGKDGYVLRRQLLGDYITQNPEPFDVVCSFQVLEHIAEPLEFLRDCVKAVRPGGLILLGTPNANSFLQHAHNLLDLPPHHMGHWSSQTYSFLQTILPVQLKFERYEPLAPYHVEYYMDTMHAYYSKTKNVRASLHTGMGRKLTRLALNAGLRRYIKGQSMLAGFTRNN